MFFSSELAWKCWSCWNSISHRCWSFPLENVMLELQYASMFTQAICCNADPRAHFTEMDLQGLEWTWEACICTNTPVTLMQVVNEFENHCPKSLSHSNDVAASTFALWNIGGRNTYITIIEEEKKKPKRLNRTRLNEERKKMTRTVHSWIPVLVLKQIQVTWQKNKRYMTMVNSLHAMNSIFN